MRTMTTTFVQPKTFNQAGHIQDQSPRLEKIGNCGRLPDEVMECRSAAAVAIKLVEDCSILSKNDTLVKTTEHMKGLLSEFKGKTACHSCQQPIEDQYLFKVDNDYWHGKCMQCHECNEKLDKSCLIKDGRLYCKSEPCRERAASVSCGACKQTLAAKDLVMRAKHDVYHLRCFTCDECATPLKVGDEFAVRDGMLYCKDDYEFMQMERTESYEDLTIAEGSPASSDRSTHSSLDDKKEGIKRPRTILTSSQRKAFKMSFEISPKPCRKVREELSKETGLSVRVVQVWFQNQRAKLKKIARKTNPDNEGSLHKKDGSGKINRRKGKTKGLSQSKSSPCGPIQNSPGDMLSLPPPDSMPYGNVLPIQQETYNQFQMNISQHIYDPSSISTAMSNVGHYQGVPQPMFRFPTRDYPYPTTECPPIHMSCEPRPTDATFQQPTQSNTEGQENHLQLMHHMLNSF